MALGGKIMAKKKTAKKVTTDESKAAKPVYAFGFREKEYPSLYINNAQFSSSDLELRIDLCEIQEGHTDKNGVHTILVTPKARVFMSWPFVVRFNAVMQQQIEMRKNSVTEEWSKREAEKLKIQHAKAEPVAGPLQETRDSSEIKATVRERKVL